jgi:hypothetical protein
MNISQKLFYWKYGKDNQSTNDKKMIMLDNKPHTYLEVIFYNNKVCTITENEIKYDFTKLTVKNWKKLNNAGFHTIDELQRHMNEKINK